MNKFKKAVCIVLAICLLSSIAVTAAFAVVKTEYREGEVDCIKRDEYGSIVYDDNGNPVHYKANIEYGKRPVISDVVNSDPDIQVGTKTYRFYMPDSWYNDRNDNYDGNSLDSCCPGIYWWVGSYSCDNYKGDNAQGWPGYRILEQDPDEPHIFVAHVPEDVSKLIFTNTVDRGTDKTNPRYTYNCQSADVLTCYNDVDDDPYMFYPNGLQDCDGMIYVLDGSDTTVSDFSGQLTTKGDWFYYYGKGKYGVKKTLSQAENADAVFSNGDFPSALKISDTSLSFTSRFACDVYCNAEPDMLTVESEDTSVATVSSVTAVYEENWNSMVTVSAVDNGETSIKFIYTDSQGNKSCRTCKVSVVINKPYVETDSNHIYFDIAGWKNFNNIYCHIWEIGGNDFFGWQTGYERCEKVNGTIYSYDLSKLLDSEDISGGFNENKDYCVIFSSNTGIVTYDLTISAECAGDIASMTGIRIENPVDSRKIGYEAVWEKNNDKYGPHLAFTSIGNIVGSKLGLHETGIKVIGDWIAIYYNSPNVDAVEALAKAYVRFGIKTLDDVNVIFEYVKTAGKANVFDLDKIKKVLEDAFYKAYPESTTPTTEPTKPSTETKISVSAEKKTIYVNASTKVKATVKNGLGATAFISSNSSVASVKVSGNTATVTGKSAGTVTITAVNNGKIASVRIKVIKKNNPMTVKSTNKTLKYTAVKKKAQTFKVITVKGAKGTVTYTKKSGNSKITINKNTGKITVKKGLKKGTYTYKVNVKAAGNKEFGAVTKTVTIKIKIVK